MTRNRNIRSISYAIAVGFLITGCAATGPSGLGPEEQVTKRAQERWDLLLAGKLEAAYEYLSPAQRSATSLMDFQRNVLASKVRRRGAQALDADCQESVCIARVRLDIQVMAAVPGVSSYEIGQVIDEKWIRVENQWWYVPE